jgi:predicted ATPase
MRLHRLYVKSFKNLKELNIDFDEKSPFTVLVGENGAGKSNLIEALTLIFRNIDLDIEAPFSYEIEYRCRDRMVKVEAEEGRVPRFWASEPRLHELHELSRKAYMSEDADGRPNFRPAFVFGYYSGPNERLADLYEKHRERFYTWIIKPRSRRSNQIQDANSLRRLFYAQNLHGQFALLAFFVSSGEGAERDREFLREHLQIEGLDSVLFALKRPPWRGNSGDGRFWNAEGEVREFLSRLYDAALMPMRMSRRMPVDLTKTPSIENLYLFLQGADSLKSVYQTYTDQYAFFTALESTHLSKLLGEVRTRVRMTPAGGGGPVTYRDLSEGEQQLLLVLGLLKFTARDEALFLLDEPDTHLNPVWSTQYLDFLSHFIQLRNRNDSCHIVMTTHDPLVFSGLERSQVRIFRRGLEGVAICEEPDQDPRGMGVAAILTSDLFRLRTTLDKATQEDLDRQRVLAMSDMSPEVRRELEELDKRLSAKGFSHTVRDPLYELFLKAWTEREDPEWRETVQLSPEDRANRERLAAEIVAELRESV